MAWTWGVWMRQCWRSQLRTRGKRKSGWWRERDEGRQRRRFDHGLQTNITIGRTERTEKRSYFEIRIVYTGTKIRSCLNNSYKTVLGSKTIVSSFIIQRTLDQFFICYETTPCLQYFAIAPTSLVQEWQAETELRQERLYSPDRVIMVEMIQNC
jgi:hypothetical protein